MNKLNKIKDYKFLMLFIILVLISSIIAYYRVIIQIGVGPIWDTFDFLSNAMYFAGQGFGYVDLTRPPVLPFITSIIFRIGFISEVSIYLIDGLMLHLGTSKNLLLFHKTTTKIILRV